METILKLFRVKIGNGKYAYVVAESSTMAEDLYLDYLRKKDWFFAKDRYVLEVLFIAETGDYPLGDIQLFVQK